MYLRNLEPQTQTYKPSGQTKNLRLGFAIEKFINNLKVKNIKTQGTIRQYQRQLEDFEKFVGSEILLSKINLEKISDYQAVLMDSGKKPRTVFGFLVCLRAFFKWYSAYGYSVLPWGLIELPRFQYEIRNIPTVQEIEKVRKVIKTRTLYQIRDRAIFETLTSSGLRVAELCSLKLDQIDLVSNKGSVIGKGNKLRIFFFSELASLYIKKWLSGRTTNSQYLFKSDIDEAIEPRSVQRMFAKYSKLAGVKVRPHDCRHFFATQLLQKGMNLFSVSKLLGHSSPTVTSIYLHYSDTQLQDEYRKYIK